MKWQIKKIPPEKFFKRFKNYHKILLILLWQNGLRTPKLIDNFLFPKYKDIFKNNSCFFSDFNKFVKIITSSIKYHQKICIYGDYDFDGIASIIILKSFLEKLNIQPYVYIPDREKEGYGLNEHAMKLIAKLNVKILITVDCGISNFTEIKLAKKLGLKSIIIDHHIVNRLPQADAIINPYKKSDSYPFKKFSCTGLVFKICQRLQNLESFKNLFPENFGQNFLDLVSFATIADYMDLVGENRNLVIFGLKQSAINFRLPFKLIFKKIRYSLPKIKYFDGNKRFYVENLNANIIRYCIVPRINIAGRLDHSSITYGFLSSKNIKEISKYFQLIENLIKRRQKQEKEILKTVIQEIKKEKLNNKKIILIVLGQNVPSGILPNIASQLVEFYRKPVFAIRNNKKVMRGSARSFPNYNLLDLLKRSRKFLLKYGGHKQAAGFELYKKNINKLRDRLFRVSGWQEYPSYENFPIQINYSLTFQELDIKLLDIMRYLEPFGKGNEEPIFMIKNVKILRLKKSQNYTNLLIEISSKNKKEKRYFKGVISKTYLIAHEKNIEINSYYNILSNINEELYQNHRNISLKVLDLKKCKENS